MRRLPGLSMSRFLGMHDPNLHDFHAELLGPEASL